MNNRSHKILERQLKRFRLSADTVPDLVSWQSFLESVSSLYQQAQEDKILLEHSLEIASKEMKERLEKDTELSIQLAQANKMASLGTLASGVAHELNNPLGGVRGYAEMLLESRSLEADSRKKLERIVALSERMASIVSHLLKLSRKSDTQTEEQWTLSAAISEIVEFYRSKLAYENIELHVDVPESLNVIIDFQRFTSIVQNLLNNSIDEFSRRKFPDGFQKRFVIQTRPVCSNEECIQTEFIDNAGGISADVIEKIFDPFFTTKEVGKGTGLGLSLSRQIAKELGGDLSVSSKNGETTFLLETKQSKEAMDSVISSLQQAAPQSNFERTPGTKFRLLLVDDEPDILEVLNHVLKDYFEVVCLSDSTEVIAYLTVNPCDILMTDLKMPKLAGDQLMKAAREVNPNIGLVLMSGHVMASSEIGLIEQGQFVLINKPVPKTKTLVQLIQSSLDFLQQKAS